MRCTLIRRRRLLPLLLLVPLLLPGCATLYWQEGARTIGEPTETTRELDEPAVKLSVAGDTDEALAILVEVERRRLVESHQDIRLRREGHWQNGEMHGTRWFGALAAHHILWGLLGVVALARGDIPDDVGYVSFVHSNVGAAVLSIPALFNISTENMAPVMRPGKRKTVTRTERELRLAARGAEVTLLNGDTELGTATTDRSGEATFALTADDPAALENTVQARSGDVTGELSLEGARIHLVAHQRAIAALLSTAGLDEARAHIRETRVSDDLRPALWPDFCRAVRGESEAGGDILSLHAILDGFPQSEPACVDAVSHLGVREVTATSEPRVIDALLSKDVYGPARPAMRGAVCTNHRRHIKTVLGRGDASEFDSWLGLIAGEAACEDLVGELAPGVRKRVASALSREDLETADTWIVLLEGVDAEALDIYLDRRERLATTLEARAEAAEAAWRRRVGSTWPRRIEAALTACDRFHAELSRRRSKIWRMADEFHPDTEREQERLQQWLEGQEEGAFGDALEELRVIMDEMEEIDGEGEDTSERRQQLAWKTQDRCSR